MPCGVWSLPIRALDFLDFLRISNLNSVIILILAQECYNLLAMQKYDLVVIGAGPGGYVAAIRAAQLGAKVALIEKDQVGGTCLNRGCIPTKAIISCINLYRQMQKADQFGITAENVSIDYKKVIARKNQVVSRLRKGIEFLLKKHNVELIQGEGILKEPGLVGVGSRNDISGQATVLATGSSPTPLPGIDFDGKKFLTSDDALNLDKLPQEINIVGGGVIGIHFAAIYSALGVKVTIYEALPEILPGLDEEIAKSLRKILEKQGVKILTGAKFNPSLATEKNLICVGRKPNQKVTVNEKMETELPGVYAVGDVTGVNMLAHVAYEQGMVAAENACRSLGEGRSGNKKMDYSAIPVAIYTHPEIGCVGLAGKEGVKFPFSALGIAQASGETDGFIKIISDEKSGKILGVHMIGPHATDLLGMATLAIKQGLRVEELGKVIQAHPTYAEGIYEAALAVAKRSLHFISL